MCGEKPHPHGMIFFSLGSPPHVRGKAIVAFAPGSDDGITPACAGKSGFHTYCTFLNKDHPRMCGEKL